MNKEDRKIYNKDYYTKNLMIIKNKMKEKIICPLCGTLSSKSNMCYHQKTDKCKKLQKNGIEKKKNDIEKKKNDIIKLFDENLDLNKFQQMSIKDLLKLFENNAIPEELIVRILHNFFE